MSSDDRGCKHAVRPKLVRGVGEDEELEWRKLADRLKAAKNKEGEEGEKTEEEEVAIEGDEGGESGGCLMSSSRVSRACSTRAL